MRACASVAADGDNRDKRGADVTVDAWCVSEGRNFVIIRHEKGVNVVGDDEETSYDDEDLRVVNS